MPAVSRAIAILRLLGRFRVLRWGNAPSYDEWRKDVDKARRQSFSIDRGNDISGVTIVAVPILNPSRAITHAFAAVGLGRRLGRDASLALVRDMQRAAMTVASQMISPA